MLRYDSTRFWASVRRSNVCFVEKIEMWTFGSDGGSATMMFAPKNWSSVEVWTCRNTLRRFTRPAARSSSEMSGNNALLTASAITVGVGAPPPLEVSAMTWLRTSLMSL